MRTIQTPLSWQEWDRSLSLHLDQQFRWYIFCGIKHGFCIGFDYNHAFKSSHCNMPSPNEQLKLQVVRVLVNKIL